MLGPEMEILLGLGEVGLQGPVGEVQLPMDCPRPRLRPDIFSCHEDQDAPPLVSYKLYKFSFCFPWAWCGFFNGGDYWT